MLKKVTYKDQVYEYLKTAIVKGELQSGQIYSEQQFADLLKVSRTPVREAILQLKNEDLIKIYNNRGFGIKEISTEDVLQILQARTAIESYSIRYLIERIHTSQGKETLCELDACLERAVKLSKMEKDHYEFMKSDVEFHAILVRFTGNKYFIRIIDQMRTRMEQATVHSLALKNRHIQALVEHQQILAYIHQGNLTEAERAYEEHMNMTVKILHCQSTISQ